MKKHLSRMVTAVIYIVSLFALSAGTVKSTYAQVPSQAPTETIIVRGHVINPPSGARVQAVRRDGTLAAETYVGPAGQYAFPPLALNVYRLQVVDAHNQRQALTGDSQVDVWFAGHSTPHEYVLTVKKLSIDTQPSPSPTPDTGPKSKNAVVSAATGQINGVVTGADTGLPVPFTSVEVYDQTGVLINTASTDFTTGAYSLTGLATGIYTVHFVPPSSTLYAPKWYNNQYDQANATGVPVTDGLATNNINASLDIGGQITGKVTDVDGGAPLSDVWVDVYTSRTASTYDYIASAYTDATGTYTVTGLPAGNYYLSFSKTDYLTGYYNNQASLAEADAVSVLLNTVTSNINTALKVGGKISGNVTAKENGAPLADVEVEIYTYTQNCGIRVLTYVGSATTDASGNYTVTQLATGNYLAHFLPLGSGASKAYLDQYYNNQSSIDSANTISVTVGQTTGGINAALTKGGTITGQVTAQDGGAPLKDVYVDVYTISGNWVNDAMTDSSGAYTVTALPTNNYKVEFDPSDTGTSAAYITQYYNNKTTFSSADQVNVVAGAVLSGINAVLTRGGQFTGQVTAADGGASLEGVWVDVYDSQGNWTGSGTTNSSGVYTTTGLATGSYRLEFSPGYGAALNYLGQYYNNKPTLATADPIALTAPAVMTINAVLARGGTISGTVTSSITGKPLAGVTVDILNGSGNEVEETDTDANGQYLAQGLPTGVYRVHFILPFCSLNYQIYYNQKPNLNTADSVSVSAPSITPNINAQLSVPGTITVRQCFLPMILR